MSCLAIIDVNNSFTHIHNPLLLLIHRSLDRKGHAHQPWQKKAQFKESSSIKVHEWVSCLEIVDVNNSFTHLHNPLLLLIHRSMDQKGHAHKRWWEKGTMQRMQFHLNMTEWVRELPCNYRSQQQFHSHSHLLLLLVHRSMDQKGHVHKLWWEKGTI